MQSILLTTPMLLEEAFGGPTTTTIYSYITSSAGLTSHDSYSVEG